MRNRVLYCLRFVIGIVNPRWMPQAPSGESAHETVTLAFEVGKWQPSRLYGGTGGHSSLGDLWALLILRVTRDRDTGTDLK